MNRRGAATRVLLLDAGWELLREQTFADAIGGMSAHRIATAAGVTPGAFFHHFPTMQAYSEAMAEHLLSRVEAAMSRHSGTDGRQLGSDGQHERAVVPFDVSWPGRDDPEALGCLVEAMRLWPVAVHGPQLDSTIRRSLLHGYFDPVVVRVRQRVEAALLAADLEVVAPLKPVDLAVILTTLSEGFAFRSAIQPDTAAPDLQRIASAALVRALTVPRGSAAPVDGAAGTSVASRANRVDSGGPAGR